MKSIAELEEIRKKALEKIGVRANAEGYRVIVGMATCGIAAGARPVMNAFMEELNKREVKNTSVTMTGCVGVCRLEPIVEVIDPNGNKTTYVKMTAEKAARIVTEHIVNGRICVDYTIGYEEKK